MLISDLCLPYQNYTYPPNTISPPVASDVAIKKCERGYILTHRTKEYAVADLTALQSLIAEILGAS